jgi:nucleoside-diphosphate-sugar epimerase
LEYGRTDGTPVAEDHPVNPLCPHAVNKLAVEAYLRVFHALFGMRYAVARVTNPYGPGQPKSRTAYGIVNRMIHLALLDDVLNVYGDGSQRRDYIYVDDVSSALVRLAETPQSDGRIYNVGSGTGIRFVDMARRITEVAGSGRLQQVPWPALDEQIETGDFVADISRISSEIGWGPTVSLDDGLQRTIAFYRARCAS